MDEEHQEVWVSVCAGRDQIFPGEALTQSLGLVQFLGVLSSGAVKGLMWMESSVRFMRRVMIRSRLLESRLKADSAAFFCLLGNYYKWTKNCHERETRQFTKTMWLQCVGQDSAWIIGQINRLWLLSFTESPILHLFLKTFKARLNTWIQLIWYL